MPPISLSRRDFLAGAAATAGALALLRPLFAAEDAPQFSFCVVGDTHFLADKTAPEKMDAVSLEVNTRLIDALNALPDKELPGGGKVTAPRGLIHCGDLIDSGDKNGGVYPQMHRTEWKAYVESFGLDGKDGRLKLPVYEVHGNHDGPQAVGVAIDGIKERNKKRPGLLNISPNGLHYSWNWGGVHFLNLGINVAPGTNTPKRQRYNPVESHEFLVADLEKHATENKPVIITHHVDMARYIGACETAPDTFKEWDACAVRNYYDALKNYNIAAIFYGHTHSRNVFRWDGESAQAKNGLSVFNVDNSAHFAGDAQALFYVEVGEKQIVVREYATTDGWQSGKWTKESWTAPLQKQT